jgi:flagellin FlaB
MVLVAAIAAGVLINTAGFLQTQAEATGEESTAQVSDRLQVVSQSGNVTNTQTIDNLTFVVAQSPGASAIDLEQVTIEFIGTNGQQVIDAGSSTDVTISNIIGVSNNVLTDSSDRAKYEVDFNAIANNDLNEGDRLSVTFTTASGASSELEIRVPTTLTEDDSSVRL